MRRGDDEMSGGALMGRLPEELRSLILNKVAQTPEHRYVLARVCRVWRRTVFAAPPMSAYHDRLTGTREQEGNVKGVPAMATYKGAPAPDFENDDNDDDSDDKRALKRLGAQMGAPACRMRLALEAIRADDPSMLTWALFEMLAWPVPDRAVCQLWGACVSRSAVRCLAVLRTPRAPPPVCLYADSDKECDCARDPRWAPAGPKAADARHDWAWPFKSCWRARLVLKAAAKRRYAIFDQLVQCGLSHPNRWAQEALTVAIANDTVPVLLYMASCGLMPYAIGANNGALGQNPFQPVKQWVTLAIRRDSIGALNWLARQPWIENGMFRRGLVCAAESGSTQVAVWLCRHNHLDAFLASLAVAVSLGRTNLAQAIAPFGPIARIHGEAHGEVPHKDSKYVETVACLTTAQTQLLQQLFPDA